MPPYKTALAENALVIYYANMRASYHEAAEKASILSACFQDLCSQAIKLGFYAGCGTYPRCFLAILAIRKSAKTFINCSLTSHDWETFADYNDTIKIKQSCDLYNPSFLFLLEIGGNTISTL